MINVGYGGIFGQRYPQFGGSLRIPAGPQSDWAPFVRAWARHSNDSYKKNHDMGTSSVSSSTSWRRYQKRTLIIIPLAEAIESISRRRVHVGSLVFLFASPDFSMIVMRQYCDWLVKGGSAAGHFVSLATCASRYA